jgi:hypothetical protein
MGSCPLPRGPALPVAWGGVRITDRGRLLDERCHCRSDPASQGYAAARPAGASAAGGSPHGRLARWLLFLFAAIVSKRGSS